MQFWRNALLKAFIGAYLASVLFPAKSTAQRYPFFSIGIEQGLIQSQVSALVQDKAGHLWAGTLGGISCYDGHTFRSFTKRDGLPANEVSALACDSSGVLWIGTSNGLSKYDGFQFTNFSLSSPDNPLGNRVLQLIADNEQVWTISFRSLYRLREGKMDIIALPTPKVSPRAILSDHHGGIWLAGASANYLYHYHNNVWDSLFLASGATVIDLAEDRDGHLFILTNEGLYQSEAGKLKLTYPDKTATSAPIFSFAQAGDGSYWLSTATDVVQILNGKVQRYDRQNGLTDVLVQQILCDREGNLWFATNGEGLYRFSGATFTAVDAQMGLTGPQVSSIAQTKSGLVFLGSFDGGLYEYAGGKVKQLFFPGEQVRSAITALIIQENSLVIGTQNRGLWIYDLSTKKLRPFSSELIGANVTSMLPDGEKVWVASNKSLAKISILSKEVESAEVPPVQAFTKIGIDSLLLYTSSGLMLYAHNNLHRFVTGSGADSGQIICMDFRKGTIWLGTVDNGVYSYQLAGGKTLHVNRSNGLRSDFIYNVCAVSDNEVWVGTGYGICSISDIWNKPRVKFYGRNAGLIGMESNRNAVLPLPDGRIWFGTTGGAVLYHPENSFAITKPQALELQKVQLFGESIRDTSWYQRLSAIYAVPQHLQLPWQQNNLTFSFQAISLTGDESIVYRYRLEGLPAPWSEWSANKTVNFSALPPGKFTLLVQSSTDGTNPTDQQLSYPFEIITPFHKTGLFKLLILGTCILLGVILQYIAARRKRRRLAMIAAFRREEQARVRERTAEDFHDEVGNKLTRINVLTNVLRTKIPNATTDALRVIEQIQDNAKQLYSGTRDILWSLQPANDTLFQVLSRIKEFGHELFGDTDIHFEMQGLDPNWKEFRIPMDMHRNLIMIFKEALNNALKYADAGAVIILAKMETDYVTLKLQDNGKGFKEDEIIRGQGLINMKSRAARLGGIMEQASVLGKGTTITLWFKIPPNKG